MVCLLFLHPFALFKYSAGQHELDLLRWSRWAAAPHGHATVPAKHHCAHRSPLEQVSLFIQRQEAGSSESAVIAILSALFVCSVFMYMIRFIIIFIIKTK